MGRSLRFPACLVLLGLLATPAAAQQPTTQALPFITVEGQASAEVVPDTAQLSIGVEADRPTASAATADVAKAAQAVMDQIKAEGIDDKDVATTSVSLSPVYPETALPGTSQPARSPRAFRAATELLVTIRPADRAGMVAAHLVDKGANTIEGIDFSSSDAARRMDDLRTAAMLDARHKAEVYVAALGLHLGSVLEINPLNAGGFQPRVAMQKTSILAAPPPPIPVKSGTLTLQASVNVRWAIAP